MTEKPAAPSSADELAPFGRALGMLDAFGLVGVRSFHVTFTDIDGQQTGYQANRSRDELRRSLAPTLENARRDRRNVIIRPVAEHLIQLDDLSAEAAAKIGRFAFMTLNTSPGNFQAWLAISDPARDKDERKSFARRVRKGTGADLSASGSTRLVGSLNFKTKYAPAFPSVEMTEHNPGRKTSAAELEAAGFVAAPEEPAAPRHVSERRYTGPKKWPSYGQTIGNAPPATTREREGQADRSKADFVWCMTALDWGWSIEDTAARLMEESDRARARGKDYALVTARNAAAAIERRGQPLKSTLPGQIPRHP